MRGNLWIREGWSKRMGAIFILILALLKGPLAVGQSTASAIEGFWMDDDKVLTVEIKVEDGRLTGTILWLAEPVNDFGEPVRDVMNREPKLRSRKVIGLRVLRGFREDGGDWKGGEYYDYTSGHWYNARISLENNDELKMTGYYGILFFLGKNKRWNRLEELPD